jgi:hypothetical protein
VRILKDFKSNVFARADSKGVRDAFFASADSKGLNAESAEDCGSQGRKQEARDWELSRR